MDRFLILELKLGQQRQPVAKRLAKGLEQMRVPVDHAGQQCQIRNSKVSAGLPTDRATSAAVPPATISPSRTASAPLRITGSSRSGAMMVPPA